MDQSKDLKLINFLKKIFLKFLFCENTFSCVSATNIVYKNKNNQKIIAKKAINWKITIKNVWNKSYNHFIKNTGNEKIKK